MKTNEASFPAYECTIFYLLTLQWVEYTLFPTLASVHPIGIYVEEAAKILW
jgi:hypothetical protein